MPLCMFCWYPLKDTKHNSQRMVPLLVISDQCLFSSLPILSASATVPSCSRGRAGREKGGGVGRTPQRRTSLQWSANHDAYMRRQTPKPPRRNKQEIWLGNHQPPSQATRRSLPEEQRGWPSEAQTQHHGNQATANTWSKPAGDGARGITAPTPISPRHKRKPFQNVLQRDNKTPFPTSALLTAKLAEICKLKKKKIKRH